MKDLRFIDDNFIQEWHNSLDLEERADMLRKSFEANRYWNSVPHNADEYISSALCDVVQKNDVALIKKIAGLDQNPYKCFTLSESGGNYLLRRYIRMVF